MRPVDIIVPVYGGLEDTRLCLDALLACPQMVPHELIVIDDASPDPDLERYLKTLAAGHQALTLHRNGQNLGFVATVNCGMRLHPDRDVVLLNSDTRPSGNWLDRIHRCAESSKDVGTVTPFSNNATICSFPLFCRDNPLPAACDLETLDNLFARCNANSIVPIPTAVGFCMYIKRTCLEQVGFFDEEKFGRGYGEENDFCLRATRAGWHHLLCADAFVYHKGGVSFGAEKAEREEAALQTLNFRYPEYGSLIAKHLLEDPAQRFRARVSIELARTGDALTVLHVTHNMGGGTDKHILDLDECLGNSVCSLVLRPAVGGVLVVSLGVDKDSAALSFQLPEDSGLLIETCRYLGVGRIHFHHTMGLDPWLWRLADRLRVPLDVTLHDYYLINANPTLIDENARFSENRDTRDEQCASAYPIPGGVTADHWRRNQRLLLDNAERVFAPSRYAADMYRSYFTALEPIVAAHPDWERDAPYPPPSGSLRSHADPFRVLVLGALSREKGADLLEATAVLCQQRNLAIEFVLLGYAYRQLAAAVSQRGAYRDEDLDSLIVLEAPHVIWFPAQWPETYSYTLSAALRAGRPIAAPAFGSFPERLQGRALTWVNPCQWGATQWSDFFAQIDQPLGDEAGPDPRGWSQPTPGTQSFRYRKDYARSARTVRSPPPNPELLDLLTTRIADATLTGRELTRRERILRKLVRLRQERIFSAAARLVPFGMQRRIKRWLSSRPIHEIISD